MKRAIEKILQRIPAEHRSEFRALVDGRKPSPELVDLINYDPLYVACFHDVLTELSKPFAKLFEHLGDRESHKKDLAILETRLGVDHWSITDRQQVLTAVQKCGAGRPNFAALGW